VVTPITGKDVLPATATPTQAIQNAAPLPDNQAALPAESIQSDSLLPPSEAVQTPGINWRLVGIGGGVLAGALLLTLLLFRLRG
jgi:hypothetical protein